MTKQVTIKAQVAVNDAGEIEALAWPAGSTDRIGDQIEKGAFAGVDLPLPMLFGHDPNDPVGAWETAEETSEGLRLKGRLLVQDVARAREVRALVRSGAVRGVSIGFRMQTSKRRTGGGRTITALELLECSLVAIPMNPGARVVSAKSAIRALQIAGALYRATAHLFKHRNPK